MKSIVIIGIVIAGVIGAIAIFVSLPSSVLFFTIIFKVLLPSAMTRMQIT